MATPRQIEANQNNARRSTGPRTAEGKARSRLNALRHGLRADAFEVLPDEDPDEFQAQLEAWFEDERPTTEAQARLVRRAAVLSWKIDRADRYETTVLSDRVREAADRVESARLERCREAAGRLLPASYLYLRNGPDGLDLDALRAEVEGSAEGCRWLIERWAHLLRESQRGRGWDEGDEFHATRLLGRSPADPAREAAILEVVMANRVLARPEARVTPQNWSDGIGDGYGRLAVMEACMRQPADRDEARSRLIRAAGDEMARLEGVLALRLREGDVGASEAKRVGRKAWFDPSPEGERLRRHQSALHRELIRTLEALARLRAEDARRQEAERRAMAEAEEIEEIEEAEPADPPIGPDPAEATADAPKIPRSKPIRPDLTHYSWKPPAEMARTNPILKRFGIRVRGKGPKSGANRPDQAR